MQTYCRKCLRIYSATWASTFDGYMTKIYINLRKNADKRKIDVNINKDDIITLYHQQNGVCALTGQKMTHRCNPDATRGNRYLTNISVDRINSQKAYEKDNIQLVCSIINTIKWDLPHDEFIWYCYLTYKNNPELVKKLKEKRIVN